MIKQFIYTVFIGVLCVFYAKAQNNEAGVACIKAAHIEPYPLGYILNPNDTLAIAWNKKVNDWWMICNDAHCAAMDSEGNIVGNTIVTITSPYNKNGVAVAATTIPNIQINRYGLIDKHYQFITAFDAYDEIIDLSNGFFRVKHYSGNRNWQQYPLYGIINSEGKEVVPPIYNNIHFVTKEFGIADKEGNSSIFDLSGKIVYSATKDIRLWGFDWIEGCFWVSDNLKFGYYDPYAGIVDFNLPFDYIEYNHSYGTCFVNGISHVAKADKHGAIDIKHNIVVPLQYDDLDYPVKYNGWIPVRKDKKHGFVDNHGQVIVPLIYDNCLQVMPNFAVMNRNDTTFMVYNNGRVFVATRYYAAVDAFSNGLALASTPEQKVFRIDTLGNDATERYLDEHYPPYEIIYQLGNLTLVRKNNRWGIVDPNNQIILPLEYDEVIGTHQIGSSLVAIRRNNAWGMVGLNGKLAIETEYDELESYFFEGLVKARVGKKWGMLDSVGNAVVDFAYDTLGRCHSNRIAVRSDSTHKLGFIDTQSKQVIGCIYDQIQDFIDGYAVVCRNNLWGIIDTTGNEVVSCSYFRVYKYTGNDRQIGLFNEKGVALVQRTDKRWCLVDAHNKFVVTNRKKIAEQHAQEWIDILE